MAVLVESSPSKLEAYVEQAHAHEARTGEMSRKLMRMLAELHSSIAVSQDDRLNSLLQFVDQYVSYVPRLVQALEAAGIEAQQEALVAPVVKQIRSIFRLSLNEGLSVLLDRAYQVQRIVEELNDHYMMLAGAPLLTLDMTTANLIIHSLIGEPFANYLDEEAVVMATDMLNEHVGDNTDAFYANNETQRLKMWAQAWSHWSQELGVEGIELRLRN